MIKFTLVFQSLLNRLLSCLLIILTLAFSISLFFTVSRIQESVRSSFQNTISGVDSVVAARGGNLQILLNSVFLIGEPSSTIKWDTYKDLTDNNKMKWAVPISLGDSHKGYRVIGTNNDYFKEIKYSSGKSIEFLTGNSFDDVFDVVLGSVVASKLNYDIGSSIIITHGLSDAGEVHTFHSEKDDDHAKHEEHDDHADHGDHDDHAKHEEHDDHADHGDHDDHAKHEEHDDHADHGDHDDHAKHEEHDDHAGHDHGDLGFKVTGILKPTGTPIDNAVYISLAGVEASTPAKLMYTALSIGVPVGLSIPVTLKPRSP